MAGGMVAGPDIYSNERSDVDQKSNGHPESGNVSGTNKLSNKKFFKSKIDFMAPIKSLRG